MAQPDVFTRVERDLAIGHTHLATQRLRGYLNDHPHDMQARRILAEIYRQTGNLVEAGRWAYLSAHAHPAELAAFEHAHPSPWLRLRRLRFTADPRLLSPVARERLAALAAQAEQAGPPPIWSDPGEGARRRSLTFPCLFVLIALFIFIALALIGAYRAVMWFLVY